jgi:hypothetical protein
MESELQAQAYLNWGQPLERVESITRTQRPPLLLQPHEPVHEQHVVPLGHST